MEMRRPLVSVVDNDESVLESVPDLLRAFDFRAAAFSSAQDFLASDSIDGTECLILDIDMPGTSGPELQRELQRQGRDIPIVFITALDDDALRRRLLRQGAVECLSKPFSETALLDALDTALRPH